MDKSMPRFESFQILFMLRFSPSTSKSLPEVGMTTFLLYFSPPLKLESRHAFALQTRKTNRWPNAERRPPIAQRAYKLLLDTMLYPRCTRKLSPVDLSWMVLAPSQASNVH
jgi:hypothetical protein